MAAADPLPDAGRRGFDGHQVLVFEVVDDQAPAVAASRVAEYLVEMGDLERAAPVGEALRQFPGDLGALAARIAVQLAQGETAPAAKTLEALLSRLSNGGDRYLPWDRRVSLAIVLAQAGRADLARDQAARCLKDANEERLRSLTTGSLFNLLVIGRALGSRSRTRACGTGRGDCCRRICAPASRPRSGVPERRPPAGLDSFAPNGRTLSGFRVVPTPALAMKTPTRCTGSLALLLCLCLPPARAGRGRHDTAPACPDLAKLSASAEQELKGDILPFWLKYTRNPENGGFVGMIIDGHEGEEQRRRGARF